MPYNKDGGWDPAPGERFASLSPSEVADMQDFATENPREYGIENHPVAAAIWDAIPTTERRAIVTGFGANPKIIAQYLPSNYHVSGCVDDADIVFIEGTDRMGWTLDDYVIPRLASGMYQCSELLV